MEGRIYNELAADWLYDNATDESFVSANRGKGNVLIIILGVRSRANTARNKTARKLLLPEKMAARGTQCDRKKCVTSVKVRQEVSGKYVG